MTPDTIKLSIELAFDAMYPNTRIEVVGAGDEHIEVHVRVLPHADTIWECDIDSDDDGFFHFLLADTTIELLVPYPGS